MHVHGQQTLKEIVINCFYTCILLITVFKTRDYWHGRNKNYTSFDDGLVVYFLIMLSQWYVTSVFSPKIKQDMKNFKKEKK